MTSKQDTHLHNPKTIRLPHSQLASTKGKEELSPIPNE